MRWTDSITHSTDMNLSKLRETVEDRGTWCATVHGSHRVRHDFTTEQQNNSVTQFIFFKLRVMKHFPQIYFHPNIAGTL